MRCLVRAPAVLLLAALLAAPGFAAGDDTIGQTVVVQGGIERDLYVAGGTVDVLADVAGDVIAAGGQVSIERRVRGDVLAAAGNLVIRADVGDDVRVAGGNVSLSGAVADEAVVAGGRVLIAPTAKVGGRARLAGGNVHVAGSIAEGLKAAGSRIVISGHVAGAAELYAEEIEIGPDAVIGGGLSYRSPNEARISPEAKISGTVVRHRLERGTGTGLGEGIETAGRVARLGLYVSLMVASIAMYLLFPAGAVAAARTVGAAPWISLGLGFAVLVATPFVVALLFASLIGIWVAAALLALYLVLLLAGFLTGIVYVGDRGLSWVGCGAHASRAWYLLAIVLALGALWLVRLVPVLGNVALFALLLFGLGALTLCIWRRYQVPS